MLRHLEQSASLSKCSRCLKLHSSVNLWEVTCIILFSDLKIFEWFRYYPVIHPNWLKVSQHCSAMRLCRELGRVLNVRHFIDVYVGTLICPRSRFFTSQIIFFHFWRWARIGWLLWSRFTAQFWPAVFVPTQLLNKLS